MFRLFASSSRAFDEDGRSGLRVSPLSLARYAAIGALGFAISFAAAQLRQTGHGGVVAARPQMIAAAQAPPPPPPLPAKAEPVPTVPATPSAPLPVASRLDVVTTGTIQPPPKPHHKKPKPAKKPAEPQG